MAMLLCIGLAACGKEGEEKAGEPVVYVDFTFDDVEDGADVPDVAAEGAGFKVIKDENGNGWAVSKNPADWSAIYFGTPDKEGNEIYLKDFCIETKVYLPVDNAGIDNDGGIPMFVAAEGRDRKSTRLNSSHA